MLFFAVAGAIILILAVALAWRDRQARRQGSRISYQSDKMRQNRFDTDVTTHNPMFVRNQHDWMSHPRGDQDDTSEERDEGPIGRR
jgi:hypothetical protein